MTRFVLTVAVVSFAIWTFPVLAAQEPLAKEKVSPTTLSAIELGKFIQAYNSKDIETAMKYVDVPWFGEGGETIKEKEELRKQFQMAIKRGEKVPSEFLDVGEWKASRKYQWLTPIEAKAISEVLGKDTKGLLWFLGTDLKWKATALIKVKDRKATVVGLWARKAQEPVRAKKSPQPAGAQGYKERATLKGHNDLINSVALSPDAKLVASTSKDGTVKLWDVATRKERITLKGRGSPAFSVVFSPDGKLVAAAYSHETSSVALWDVNSGREKAVFKLSNPITALTFNPDGRTLVFGTFDRMVKELDISTGKERGTFKGYAGFLVGLAFSSDGKKLASWSTKEIKFREMSTGKEKTLKQADFAEKEERPNRKSEGKVIAFSGLPFEEIVLSPDGKTLALASSADSDIKLWDVNTGKVRTTIKAHPKAGVNALAFSADGKTLVSGSYDDTIKVWDPANGKLRFVFDPHADEILRLAVSADGKLIVSASRDRVIKLWERTDAK